MASKAFGIPINPGVYNQLLLRKAVRSSNTRSPQENMYLSNNGAFVRIASSVNTKNLDTDEFTNELAKNFVLQGGVLKKSTDSSGNEKFIQRDGIGFLGDFLADNTNSSYTFQDSVGYRPMPGIDGFQVQTEGSMGVLKKAEINFQVWTQEHLDAVEQLYFRPGFNILVEYGASAYINNEDGSISTLQDSVFEHFLNKDKTLEELDLLIDELIEKSSYSYNAFIGRIINFNWSYNKEGGYDCNIKVQARGEIVESLELLLPNNKKSGLEEAGSEPEPNKVQEFTILKALNILKLTGYPGEFYNKYIKDRYGKPIVTEDTIITKSNRFNIVGLEETSEGDDAKYKPGESYENQFTFLNIGGLLAIINNFAIPENEEGVKETYFRTNRHGNEHSAPFVTFQGHVSNNPGVCMLKEKLGQGAYYSDREVYGELLNLGEEKSFYSYKYTVPPPDFHVPNEIKTSKGEVDNIYSILINIDHIIEVFEGMAESVEEGAEPTDVNVYTFLKKILSDVNYALGGINKLDLDLDKNINEWRVIDRSFYNPEKTSPGDKFSTIDLIGLGSLVKDFSLDSKIDGKTSNSLAISAAASGDSKAIGGISSYNNGVVDRYKKSLKTGPAESKVEDETTSTEEELNEKAIEYGSTVAGAYKLYTMDKKWDREAFRKMSSSHKEFTKISYDQTQKAKRQRKEKAEFKATIPIKLSITIDGISGLRVGEAFKIQNNVLPTRYHNKVGFIITNMTDVIKDNNWETQIETQFFLLPATEAPDLAWQAAQEKIQKQKEERAKKAAEVAEAAKTQKNVRAKYGDPGDKSNFARVAVPQGFNLKYDGKPVKTINGVHKNIASSLRSAFDGILREYGSEKINQLGINIYSGVYNKRQKRGGTTWSLHSWGIAIDLYATKNALRTKRPEAVFSQPEYSKMVEIFESNGWYSLGKAKNYDWMHFQAWDPNSKE